MILTMNLRLFICAELNYARYEIRKIHIYRNGDFGLADQELAHGDTLLSLEPIPSIDEINANPEFEFLYITKNEFEKAWDDFWEKLTDKIET